MLCVWKCSTSPAHGYTFCVRALEHKETETQRERESAKCLNFQHKFIYFVRRDGINFVQRVQQPNKKNEGKTHSSIFFEIDLLLLFGCIDVTAVVAYGSEFGSVAANGRPFSWESLILSLFLVRTICSLIYVQMSNNIKFFHLFDL